MKALPLPPPAISPNTTWIPTETSYHQSILLVVAQVPYSLEYRASVLSLLKNEYPKTCYKRNLLGAKWEVKAVENVPWSQCMFCNDESVSNLLLNTANTDQQLQQSSIWFQQLVKHCNTPCTALARNSTYHPNDSEASSNSPGVLDNSKTQ